MAELRRKWTDKLKANSRCVFSEHTRDVEELETRLYDEDSESPLLCERPVAGRCSNLSIGDCFCEDTETMLSPARL